MVKVALSYGHGSNTYEDKRSKFVKVNGKIYEEHTHNAKVGLVVKSHLERHGVQVLELQPANGVDVALSTRTNKANSWGADLYWSIHSNGGTPSARGWCAFYWSTSAKGKRIAQLYAKYVKELGLPLYSGDGIYPSERGTWSDFHELRESNMVACLTENGFMTNSEDFKYIFEGKDDYYNRLGKAHAKAILEYFGIAYKEPVAETIKAPVTGNVGRLVVVDYGGSDGLNIRVKADFTSKVVAVVRKGQAFRILEELPNHYRIGSGYITKAKEYVHVK